MKTFFSILAALCVLYACGHCQPQFQRVVVKRPCKLESTDNGQSVRIAKGSLYSMEQTFDIYQRISDFIRDRQVQGERKYRFRYAENKISGEYPVYVKTELGTVADLNGNEHRFGFMDVLYVHEIDFMNRCIHLARVLTNERLKLSIDYFEENFIWYTELLDLDRVFMPIYGFLGVNENPESYRTRNGYDIAHGSENQFINNESAKQSFDYDFYRVLDIKNEKMLIAGNIEEVNPWNRDGSNFINVRDMGVLGWIEEENMLIWRSRLYYHPINKDTRYYLDVNCYQYDIHESEVINGLYCDADFADFDPDRFPFFHEQMQREYYYNFGFPLLYPPVSAPPPHNSIGIGVINQIPSEYLSYQEDRIDLEMQILIDNSTSMQGFGPFIHHFVEHFVGGNRYDFSEFGCYSYYEDGDRALTRNCTQDVLHGKDILFGLSANDNDYEEPVLLALKNVLGRMHDNAEPDHSNKIRFVFLFADAGPNCSAKERKLWMDEVCDIIRDLSINLIIIHPSQPDNLISPVPQLKDTPETAFISLMAFIDDLKKEVNRDGKSYIVSKSMRYRPDRYYIFELEDRIMFALGDHAKHVYNVDSHTFVLSIRKRFIRLDDEHNFERRIMIPLRLAELYGKSAVPINPQLFHKMILLNNFKRIDNISQFNQEWEQLFFLENLHIDISEEQICQRMHQALSGRVPIDRRMVAPAQMDILEYISGIDSSRRFVLNSVKPEAAAYIYLLEDEILD